MRVCLLAVVPILLSAVHADYYVRDTSDCKPFDYGMQSFEYWQDDGHAYTFEFYEDKKCKGNKSEDKADKKKKNKKKNKLLKQCWSYKASCA
ncbi:hypothetical protein B0A48_18782 [Cryoendolithus antarcticus]|uniref:Uncharacterized protein n=1 Tax=Cryoendolithus antarcticus TaxID=1507870 RepID=A0A1V8S7P4_9PEZI|nr:hypothetical protein B0A48_18782 [Cryoendolithus antarcticus]